MPQQQIVPLFGSGVKAKSANVTAQRRINLYSEPVADGDGAPVAYYSRPGLRPGFTGTPSGSSTYGGPIRGLLAYNLGVNVVTDGLICVQGARHGIASTPASFSVLYPNYMETSSGPVQIAYNGTDLIFVDGVDGYQPSGGETINEAAGITTFPSGARSVCFLAGYFVCDDPNGGAGRFRWSGLYDWQDWPALNYATAESSPDVLSCVFERGGELLLFGSRTLEFWAPTGGAEVFARVGGSGIDWGLGAFNTVRKANDYVMFLGRNLGGQSQVCMLSGYQVRVVSNPDVEKLINDAMDAGCNPSAVVITFAGHTWYIVNLVETSVAFDLTTNEWAEWQTDGKRWAGEYSTQYRGTAIVTDYRDGRVYYLDDERYTDDDTAIVRELVTKHAFANLQQLSLWRLQLDIEQGVGLESGQGADPQVMLQVSKDGGHTWGEERWRSFGAQGQYRTRVAWNALGTADNWTFRLRVADPVKVALLNAAVEFGA